MLISCVFPFIFYITTHQKKKKAPPFIPPEAPRLRLMILSFPIRCLPVSLLDSYSMFYISYVVLITSGLILILS